MEKLIMRLIPIAVVIFFLTACAGSPVQTGAEARQNRDNMINLNIGQTKEKVLAIMGKPYKTEMYKSGAEPLEYWFYLTEGKAVYGDLDDSNFTPLSFENGILQGWGRNYYDSTIKIQKEITIK